MINKDLVEGVLNTKVTKVVIIDNQIKYNDHYVINIYEFMNMCKGWAYTKDYHLDAEYIEDFWFCMCVSKIYCGVDHEVEYCLTELEAVFRACEWILKEEK